MATETLRIVITVNGDRIVRKKIEDVGNAAQKTESAVDMLKMSLKALGGAFVIREIGSMLDSMTNISNRISIFTENTGQTVTIMNDLLEVANRTRTSFEATAKVYSRMAVATSDLGISQAELISFQERLNKATIISGARTQEANAAMIQLSQGLAAGALRGDELRSVLEQLPYVASVIAEGMGITRGELKAMGEQGLLTSRAIFESFKKMDGDINKRFGRTVPTLAQSFEILRNNALMALGEFNRAVGLTDKLSAAMQFLGENIEHVISLLTVFAIKKTAAFAVAAIDAATAAVVKFGRSMAMFAWNRPFLAIAGALISVHNAFSTTREEAVKSSNSIKRDLVSSLEKAGLKGDDLVATMRKLEHFQKNKFGVPLEAQVSGTIYKKGMGKDDLAEATEVATKYVRSIEKVNQSTASISKTLVNFGGLVKKHLVQDLREAAKSFSWLTDEFDWLADAVENLDLSTMIGGLLVMVDFIIDAVLTAVTTVKVVVQNLFAAILKTVEASINKVVEALNWLLRQRQKAVDEWKSYTDETLKEAKGKVTGESLGKAARAVSFDEQTRALEAFRALAKTQGKELANTIWGEWEKEAQRRTLAMEKHTDKIARKAGKAFQFGTLDWDVNFEDLGEELEEIWGRKKLAELWAEARTEAEKAADKARKEFEKSTGGDKTKGAKGKLEKFKDELNQLADAVDNLERSMSPMTSAQRELTDNANLLWRAYEKGVISFQHYTDVLAKAQRFTKDARKPGEAMLEEMQDELDLMRMSNDERERTIILKELQKRLEGETGQVYTLKEIKDLFDDILRDMRIQEKINQKELDIAAQKERAIQLVRGAELDYKSSLEDVTMAAKLGTITMQEYHGAVKQIEDTYRESQEPLRGFDGALQDLDKRVKNFDAGRSIGEEFVNFGEEFIDTVVDMKFAFKDLISSMIKDLTRLFLKQMFYRAVLAIAGAPSIPLPAFQYGGSFRVGQTGSGGPDSEVVAFRATPGETVTVTPAGQVGQPGSAVTSPEFNVRVVNIVDPNEAVDAMSTPAGDRVIINSIHRNAATIRRIVR